MGFVFISKLFNSFPHTAVFCGAVIVVMKTTHIIISHFDH